MTCCPIEGFSANVLLLWKIGVAFKFNLLCIYNGRAFVINLVIFIYLPEIT